MLQTLPIPKSDLISFISFRFWHLSTLSEKLQLKENDGLVFFALEPSFSKTKGFPILNRDWAKQRIQLDHIGVRNPKETVAILATKEKKQFVCCLQWEKKTPWLRWFMVKFRMFWGGFLVSFLCWHSEFLLEGMDGNQKSAYSPGELGCWNPLQVSMISTSPPTTPGRGFSTFTEDLCFFSERSVRTACCGTVEVPFSWFVDKNRFIHGVHPILKNILCFTFFSPKASDF